MTAAPPRRGDVGPLRQSACGVFTAVALVTAAAGHETDQFTVPLGMQFADLGDDLGSDIYQTI